MDHPAPLNGKREDTMGVEEWPLARSALFWFLYFAHTHDFRRAAELLVVAEGLFNVDIKVLQEGKANVNLDCQLARQPDLVVYPRLLQHKARTLVKSRQEQAPGNRVQAFDIHFGKLQIAGVDPDSPVKLG